MHKKGVYSSHVHGFKNWLKNWQNYSNLHRKKCPNVLPIFLWKGVPKRSKWSCMSFNFINITSLRH
jgi:hypothetical protein